VDRALYLPEPWTGDRDRCRAAGVPDEVGFATKPRLGLGMLERVLAAGLPFAWVAADSGYGRDPGLRAWLHAGRLRYVLAVPVDLPLSGPPGKARQPKVDKAGDLLHYAVVRDRWERRSCGEGAKGRRFYDWTAFEVTMTGQGTGTRVRAPAAGPPLHREEAARRRPDRLRVRLLPGPCPPRAPRCRR
jgi:SRSO17 transposase